jgi:hypothetical protein
MAGVLTSPSQDGSLAPGTGVAAFVTLSHTVLTRPGVYRIHAWVGMSGTVGAADNDNVKLVVGATSQKLAVPGVDGYYGPFHFQAELDGNTDVVLSSATAGPSVATYTGLIVADFMGPQGGLGSFQE